MNNTFSICIAGINILLICDDATLLDTIGRRYHNFQTEDEAELQVNINWKNHTKFTTYTDSQISFQNEQVTVSGVELDGSCDISKRQAFLSVMGSTPAVSVDYFLRVALAVLVFYKGGLMVHGAGILHHGKGYLFFGQSGSGKTTVSRASINDTVLNDDLVVLVPQENTWQMFSTPFWNPTQIEPIRLAASLSAMYRLIQDKTVFVESQKPSQALAEFISNIPIIASNPAFCEDLMERSITLLRDVPVYRLHFLPDDSFWQVIIGSFNQK